MTGTLMSHQMFNKRMSQSRSSLKNEMFSRINTRIHNQMRAEAEVINYENKPWYKKMLGKVLRKPTPDKPEDTPFRIMLAEEMLEAIYLRTEKTWIRVAEYAKYFESYTECLETFLELGCTHKRPNDNNMLLLPWAGNIQK